MAGTSVRKSKPTRSNLLCPLFGAPKDLSDNMLPTYEDVLLTYLWVRHDMKPKNSLKEPTVAEVLEVLATKLEAIWNRASIPVVSRARILQLIRSYHDKYMKIMKSYKSKQDHKLFSEKVSKFKIEAKALFDIAACKCAFSSCKCEKSRKVPVSEQPFLIDQRTLRTMIIGRVDPGATEKLRRISKRKSREVAQMEKYTSETATKESNVFDKQNESESSESSSQSDNEIYEVMDKSHSKPNLVETSKQMRIKLPTVARTCDRLGVSDRSAAAIASAVLQDVGLITKENTAKVIDRSKVRRAREKVRSELRDASEAMEIRGLYFDGRKDKTLVLEEVGGRHHRRNAVEEHLTIVREPGSEYIGHISPANGTSESIKRNIMNFLTMKQVDLDKLVAVGCDGTNVNTGNKGGVIKLLEVELGKPLQWLVCQLHANELPLRHLFQELDGGTRGPTTYSGPIGKQLQACATLPIVEFEKIASDLPRIDSSSLSTDQRYLYDICQAVESGSCTLSLSARDPGKIAHSRWLTTANRILRLYVATESPSKNLKILADFVMKVYAPMWFSIKTTPSCFKGAEHVWQTVNLSRYLSDELKRVVDPVIQRNAYFAHPENLLLGMIKDERKHIRELGLRRILKARKEQKPEIRIFSIPPLNFDAKEYIELINWQECDVSEPPIISKLSNQELERLLRNVSVHEDLDSEPVAGPSQEPASIEIPEFPCHTQAVERCVKLVTEASAAVIGPDARDGFILARIKSRHIMPSFETKAEYRAA